MILHLPPPLPVVFNAINSAGIYVKNKIIQIDEFVFSQLEKTRTQYGLPYFAVAGTVVSMAAKIFTVNASSFVQSSPFITGGLAFSAFYLGSSLVGVVALQQGLNPQTFRVQSAALLGGLVATAAFAYIASVPIVTTLAFSILGIGGRLLFDKTIKWTRWGLERVGLSPVRAFWLTFALAQVVKFLSCAACSSLMYTSSLRLLGFTHKKNPEVMWQNIATMIQLLGGLLVSGSTQLMTGKRWVSFVSVVIFMVINEYLTSTLMVDSIFDSSMTSFFECCFQSVLAMRLMDFTFNGFALAFLPFPPGIGGVPFLLPPGEEAMPSL